jgi:hypothetical protein
VVRTATDKEQDITTTPLMVVEVVVELVSLLAQVVIMVETMVPTTQVVMVEQEMDVDPLEEPKVVILVKMLQVVTQVPMVTVGTI